MFFRQNIGFEMISYSPGQPTTKTLANFSANHPGAAVKMLEKRPSALLYTCEPLLTLLDKVENCTCMCFSLLSSMPYDDSIFFPVKKCTIQGYIQRNLFFGTFMIQHLNEWIWKIDLFRRNKIENCFLASSWICQNNWH